MRNNNHGKRMLWLWRGAGVTALVVGLAFLREEQILPSQPLSGWMLWAGWLFLAAGVVLLAGAASVKRRLLEPLEEMEQFLTGDFLEIDEFRHKAREMDGLAGEVAQAAAGRLEEMNSQMNTLRANADREARQVVRFQMTEELCRSALPQVLRDSPATATFTLAGCVEEGQTLSCTYYDYFFIDAGLLCVMVGQVPGDSIAEALYMVVAQTAIRSRLRMGRSLVETMVDVNTQLYDQGARQSLCALVGTLDTANGNFTYVNAGGAVPLLMRNGERYEWINAPVYAALGLNENVSYRSNQLRLRQGDRLFLQTAGLGEMTNEAGVPFREQELRAVLNRSRSKTHTSGEILRFTADEAATYCPQDASRIGYAALVLEYLKGDKELAHCEVPAVPASAGQVTAFLNKRFADNGIQRRSYAPVAVLVDELFALCCRGCKQGGSVIVECGIAPDGQTVTVRMSAPLGGVNPLDEEDSPTANAVTFIEDRAEYLTFKAGEDRDLLTAVCFLGKESDLDVF